MADDLAARITALQAFAVEVTRDLDRLSAAQREVLRDALRRIEEEQLAEVRKSLAEF